MPDSTMPPNWRVMAVMAAIFHVEGTFALLSLGCRNNNPADLRVWGDRPIVNGFAQFDSMVQGVRAGYLDVLANKGTTLRQFIHKFAPPTENRTEAYLAYVSAWTDIGPDEVI